MEARLANVSQLTRHLWVGGDLDTAHPAVGAAQLRELESLGITSIIDCRLEWSDEDWVRARTDAVDYIWLGVDDAGQRLPDQWFQTGTDHALAAVQRGGTVLAHCHMGINRGPSMGLAVLLAQGCDLTGALDRIHQRRHIAFVGYADDAASWWLRRQGARAEELAEASRQISQWRERNHLDMAEITREIRRAEQDRPLGASDLRR